MIFLKVVYFLRFEDEVSLRFEDDKAQLCLTLCDPMDYSLPGSSVQGIFEARILEWVAIAFSRGSYQPRNGSPTLQADSLLSEPPGKSFLRFSFFN